MPLRRSLAISGFDAYFCQLKSTVVGAFGAVQVLFMAFFLSCPAMPRWLRHASKCANMAKLILIL